MTRPGPRSLYNGLVCFIASFVWPTQFFKCKWKALSITVLLLCEKLAGAEASLEEKSQKTKRTKKERESESSNMFLYKTLPNACRGCREVAAKTIFIVHFNLECNRNGFVVIDRKNV